MGRFAYNVDFKSHRMVGWYTLRGISSPFISGCINLYLKWLAIPWVIFVFSGIKPYLPTFRTPSPIPHPQKSRSEHSRNFWRFTVKTKTGFKQQRAYEGGSILCMGCFECLTYSPRSCRTTEMDKNTLFRCYLQPPPPPPFPPPPLP